MTRAPAARYAHSWAAHLAELRGPPASWGRGAFGSLPWEGFEEFGRQGSMSPSSSVGPQSFLPPLGGGVGLSWLNGHSLLGPEAGYYIILSAAHHLSDFGRITFTSVAPAGPSVPASPVGGESVAVALGGTTRLRGARSARAPALPSTQSFCHFHIPSSCLSFLLPRGAPLPKTTV